MIKTENLNGNDVVFINRQGVRIAPTYKEIRNMISELIRIYGKKVVYQEIGIEDSESCSKYKHVYIVWDEDIQIFEALRFLENKYPNFFSLLLSAGASDHELVLQVKNMIEPPTRWIIHSSEIYWRILMVT